MTTNVSVYDFVDAFLQSDTYKNNFSRSGLKALYEYLTQYEEETGEEIDFDMVAICCDYSEYQSALECAKEYGYQELEDENIDDEEKQEADALEWLEERTTVIPFDGRIYLTDGTVLGDSGIIVQQF